MMGEIEEWVRKSLAGGDTSKDHDLCNKMNKMRPLQADENHRS